MRFLISASLTSLLIVGVVHAPDARAQSTEASPFTANVALTSDYRYRGISQNNGKPAVQGGFDFASGPFYIGTWGSNVSWLSDGGGGSVSSSVELDLYGGYKGAIGSIEYDVGGLFYYYPGTYPDGFNSPDTFEIYGKVSTQGISFKYSHALTDIFGFSDSDGGGYLDLAYDTKVSDFSIGAHIGHQIIPSGAGRSSSDCSYTDWSISGGTELAGFGLKLAYIGTDAEKGAGSCYRNSFGKDLGKGTVVLTVSRAF